MVGQPFLPVVCCTSKAIDPLLADSAGLASGQRGALCQETSDLAVHPHPLWERSCSALVWGFCVVFSEGMKACPCGSGKRWWHWFRFRAVFQKTEVQELRLYIRNRGISESFCLLTWWCFCVEKMAWDLPRDGVMNDTVCRELTNRHLEAVGRSSRLLPFMGFTNKSFFGTWWSSHSLSRDREGGCSPFSLSHS